MLEKLYFYYTNDLHSNFEQWPKVTHYLNRQRAKREKNKESHWTIDIGDHADRVHPITEATLGKANVDLLNRAAYDVATIGNNEGITLSHHDLYHLYNEADFEVVCANLKSMDGVDPTWLKPSVTFQSRHGAKIAMVGLTAPFQAFYELLGWQVSAEIATLDTMMEKLQEEADVIVVLSHLGLTIDRAIAERYKTVDLIIGGHTHHLLKQPEYINNTLITAAGKHCFYIGEVILAWDTEKRKITTKDAFVTDISQTKKDQETALRIQELERDASKYLDKQVIELQENLSVDWYKDNPLITALTETLHKWTNADAALLNGGVLLEGLSKGVVTFGDIHRICPHPINPVVVDLKGDELIEVIRASLKKDFMEYELKGFGFRGKRLGRMAFSGLNVVTVHHSNGEEYVKEVTFMDGYPVDPDRTYYIATADAFTFGRLLPEVAKSTSKHYYLPEFLRDLLAEALVAYF